MSHDPKVDLKPKSKSLSGSSGIRSQIYVVLLLVFISFLPFNQAIAGDGFKIEEAKWDAEKNRLKVKGKGKNRRTVTLSNAGTSDILGTKRVRDKKWRFTFRNPESVPCRVKAEQSDGKVAERNVEDAPADCDDGNVDPPPPTGGNGAIRIIAANDLGMHCADKDYQIFSILPPFNVVHAQAIQKGTDASLPRILTNQDVDVNYVASSNPNDPAGAGSINTTGMNATGVFKTNFWEKQGGRTLGGLTYDRLYPNISDPNNSGQLISVLQLFEPLPVDLGIPVPDVAALPALVAEQQTMPGILNPYTANDPQDFLRFDKDVHFFGSVIPDANWFAADGIPIFPVDDQGRSNAYPLMKVSATNKVSGATLDSVDLVLPVASEADCQNCHADIGDGGNGTATIDVITDPNRDIDFSVVEAADAPGPEQTGNAAKMNILRLHDALHGDKYTSSVDGSTTVCNASTEPLDPNCLANQTPIQCAQCHYTPALDLAQSGPTDDHDQGIRGRQQTLHISMSRAMHFNHAEFVPSMPEADDPLRTAGGVAINDFENNILEESCYQCHPGSHTQCLRGAMFSGGVVCQDCHGGMEQVGNDYSGDDPSTLAGATKRIPWATEPKCQSCHTGDARSTNHPVGAVVAPDGIRLIQAFTRGDATATPISATASRFAENQSLYRLSGNKDESDKGHGGVMCEGCHGSTHAIWPNANPFANDNVAANQIQGHTGTIAECDSCHAAGTLGNTLGGPHGMHPVGGSEFADGGHEDLAEDQANSCRSCHGNNGEGTVLSKVATNRSFVIEECENGTLCPSGETKNFTVNLTKGQQVSCVMCHENEL